MNFVHCVLVLFEVFDFHFYSVNELVDASKFQKSNTSNDKHTAVAKCRRLIFIAK